MLQRILLLTHFGVALVFALPCSTAAAQTRPGEDAQPMEQHTANLPEMPIGRDDLLQVAVYESPELTGSVRVDARGQIFLPLLKEPIDAAGFYPAQLEASVAHSLAQAQLIVDPVVRVTVLEYRSLKVNVSGAVKAPIAFQAYGKVTLLDALVRAQGVTSDAGDVVLVTSPGVAGSMASIHRVNLKELLAGMDGSLNLQLHGGDEVRVPEAGRISIVGNVHKPGMYPIRSEGEATVLNAVAESEGLLPYASKRAYIYRAELPGERKTEIPVELSKIMDRKTGDVALLAGDILYIPDDHVRRATLGTLDKMLTVGAGAGSALIYAGVR